MAAAEGARLHHIARETSDVKRLASFYEQILGFERMETPKFGDYEVIWLKLPPFALHLIELDPHSKLLEGPSRSASDTPAVDLDPKAISRGHHLSFAVSNYDSFVRTLKEKGIRTYEKTQPDGKTKQVFFFDPDVCSFGNSRQTVKWAHQEKWCAPSETPLPSPPLLFTESLIRLAIMAAAAAAVLHHISRESSDVRRLASFYEEILGFERIEAPKSGDFELIWLKLPPISLHLIERDPRSQLPESPYSASNSAADVDPKEISRGHHLCFAVSDYDSFVRTLKEKGIKYFEKVRADGKTKQVFFFDPDGNGLEAGSWEAP